MRNHSLGLIACTALCVPSVAMSQTAPSTGSAPAAAEVRGSATEGAAQDSIGIQDIVVTAQKREQRLNDVGLTVTAVGGAELAQRGVTNTADLVKLVPGFTATASPTLAPVYTLRGVGLYESGLASAPTVSIYVDEVPLPTPSMALAATFDLERVEVLKGPQGILFGQNSTGGAINYIAAKPTDHLTAGADLTYARFGKIETNGFISGPLSDTVQARLAVRVAQGGAWQKSITRPDDKLGDSRELQGRFLLDWQASDKLKFALSLSGFRNNSDTPAGQLMVVDPVDPALAAPGLIGSPIVPNKPRLADWTPGFTNRSHDSFYQAALRSTYAIGDSVDLISVTSYDHLSMNRMFEYDGSAAFALQGNPYGTMNAFSQELRLTGTTSKLTWLVGGSYDYQKVSDHVLYDTRGSINQPVPSVPFYNQVLAQVDQKINNYAAFANLEYKLTDRLTVHGGLRYTQSDRTGISCLSDPEPGDPLSQLFTVLQGVFQSLGAKTTPVVPIAPGGCVQLTLAPDLSPTGQLRQTLNEHNVSWRGGLDYKFDNGMLMYVNASRGYKSGVISPVTGASVVAFFPVKQERLDAYEVGIKAPLFDHRIQFNAAAFYYDYRDKQLRTRILDPIFGLLELLQNVPKSRVYGVEGQIIARPTRGLDLSLAGTYLDAKVNAPYSTFNGQGSFGDYNGSLLPNTPKYSAVADLQYQWELGSSLKPFIGGSLTYNGASQGTFSTAANPAPYFNLPAYTLIDLRAGVSAADDSWRVQVFGRNITNKYYYSNVVTGTDTTYRYAGMPATYGITLAIKMR